MSCETLTRENVSTVDLAGQATSRLVALEHVAASIQRDSRRDAEQYLEESTVPHGGE